MGMGMGTGKFTREWGWGWGIFCGDGVGMGKISWGWGGDGDNFIYRVTLYLEHPVTSALTFASFRASMNTYLFPGLSDTYAQYTTPTPTRLNSTVVSRRHRQCVLGFETLCQCHYVAIRNGPAGMCACTRLILSYDNDDDDNDEHDTALSCLE